MFLLLIALADDAAAGRCGLVATRGEASCPAACVQEDWLTPYSLHSLPHDAIRTLEEQLATPGQLPPELTGLVEGAEPCQLCILQRGGSAADILWRAVGGYLGAEVPSEEISFGHCFVCVQCPGQWGPTCRGWWPADPAGGDYEGDEGRLYDDDDELWEQASCAAVSRAVAAGVVEAMASYEAQTTYQVTNRGDARSCTGFCQDMADRGGLHWLAPMGDFTIPGDLRFYSDVVVGNPEGLMPDVFMNRRLEGFE